MTLPLEPARGIQHRVVLDPGHAHAVASLLAAVPRGALDREVVGLGPAGGEHDLVRTGTDGGAHALSRFVDGLARLAPGRVHAGRVTEPIAEERVHRRASDLAERG